MKTCSESVVGVVIADVDPEIEAVYITDIMGDNNAERPDPVVGYETVPLTFGADRHTGGTDWSNHAVSVGL